MSLKNIKNISQTDVLKMMFGSTKHMEIPNLNVEIQFRDNIPSKPGNYLVIFIKLPDEEKEKEEK